MASIHSYMTKQGKKYRAEIRRHSRHLKATKSRSFDTKREAEIWAKQVEQELKTHPPETLEQPQTAHTVRDLIHYYRQHYMPLKVPNTQRAQKTILRFWEQRLGHITLAKLTPADITKYRDVLMLNRKYKTGTVRQYMSLLQAMLNVAVNELEWIEKSPMSKLSLPQDSPARQRSLSPEEIQRLLNACKRNSHPQLYPIVFIALHTGLRYSEILNIRLEHISWSPPTIVIPQTKNKQPHVIYMTNEVLAAINNHILQMSKANPQPYNWQQVRLERETGTIYSAGDEYLFPAVKTDKPTYIVKAWRRALKEANLQGQDIVFHTTRHTAGSLLANAGKSDFEIATLLNHRDYRSTRRYTHGSTQRIRENFETLTKLITG